MHFVELNGAFKMPASYLNLNTELSNELPQMITPVSRHWFFFFPLKATRQVQGDGGTGQVSGPLLWWLCCRWSCLSPVQGGPRSPVQGLGGNMQWCRSHETHLDSTLSSWHQQFLLEGCVIAPSLDLDFLICNRQRSPSRLPVLATVCWPFRASVSMLSIMWGSQGQRSPAGSEYSDWLSLWTGSARETEEE